MDSSREWFERWARDFYDCVQEIHWQADEECYSNVVVQGAWLAWQASRSAAIEECAAIAERRDLDNAVEIAAALRALKGEG